jgi:flagellum-specific peptidoglycan hydrolase FlgJ
VPIPMPVVRTPISMGDFARALLRTLRANGITPSKEACGVFWAQYALETGAGGFCWNNNLFNHKVTVAMANAGIPYMMLANTWEIENGKKVTYQPPHPATWFRAYASFEAAMSHHISAVKSGRYKSSWPAVLAGDVVQYATELRKFGYYTASLESYVALLKTKMADWMKTTAYEKALEDVVRDSERETQPDLEPYRDEEPTPTPRVVEWTIVHKSPFDEPDDEPPAAA